MTVKRKVTRRSSKQVARPKPHIHNNNNKRPYVLPVGRVNVDLAVFLFDLSEAEVRNIAYSLSKHIEEAYQIELMGRSGFGQNG